MSKKGAGLPSQGLCMGMQLRHSGWAGWFGLSAPTCIWGWGLPRAASALLGRWGHFSRASPSSCSSRQRKGRPGCCRKVSTVKLHWGKNLTFLSFNLFFRDHKYLWRACQSFLGFLTECVTREGLLWEFIVNCSELYSCQGAERSYMMSGESKQSPRYGNDAIGWICPCPRGHHEACALLKCRFSPQTSARLSQKKLPLLGQKSQRIILI